MVKVTQIEHLEAAQIKDWFLTIQEQVQNLKKHLQPKEPTVLMSPLEVAEFVGVTKATINEWRNKGYLKSYKIGHLVRYKRHEVEAALTEIKTRRHAG